MNSREKGLRAERALVGYLKDSGWPKARRLQSGDKVDRGDIEGVPRVTWEVRHRAELRLAAWEREAYQDAALNDARYGVLVLRVDGRTDPANWLAAVRISRWELLRREAGVEKFDSLLEPKFADLQHRQLLQLSKELETPELWLDDDGSGGWLRRSTHWPPRLASQVAVGIAISRVDQFCHMLRLAGYVP